MTLLAILLLPYICITTLTKSKTLYLTYAYPSQAQIITSMNDGFFAIEAFPQGPP